MRGVNLKELLIVIFIVNANISNGTRIHTREGERVWKINRGYKKGGGGAG